jgi:hypothetical protein
LKQQSYTNNKTNVDIYLFELGINSTIEIAWNIFRILADYRLRHLVNNVAMHIYAHDYIRIEITVLYLTILVMFTNNKKWRSANWFTMFNSLFSFSTFLLFSPFRLVRSNTWVQWKHLTPERSIDDCFTYFVPVFKYRKLKEPPCAYSENNHRWLALSFREQLTRFYHKESSSPHPAIVPIEGAVLFELELFSRYVDLFQEISPRTTKQLQF